MFSVQCGPNYRDWGHADNHEQTMINGRLGSPWWLFLLISSVVTERQWPSGKWCSLLSHYLRSHNHRNKHPPPTTHLTGDWAPGQGPVGLISTGSRRSPSPALPGTSDLGSLTWADVERKWSITVRSAVWCGQLKLALNQYLVFTLPLPPSPLTWWRDRAVQYNARHQPMEVWGDDRCQSRLSSLQTNQPESPFI